ncbi:MAG TPA: hypothetical protein VGG72_31865 [Bryobacteraceae bacterium]
MRWMLVLMFGSAAFAQDAKEIIRQSVHRDLLNFERLKDYTYIEHDEERSFDKHNKLMKTERQTYEVLILGGHDYEKLIERDDKPLPPSQADKEQKKMDKEIEQRKRESADDKAKIEKQRREQRKFLDEIPEEFDFKLLGVENVSGKPAWVISADPKPGYRPKDRGAKMIAKMRGKLWIDQGEYQWVKIDAEATGTLSYGFGLLKINPGATVHFEQTRVNDEVWLPASATIRVDGRAALFVGIHDEIDLRFRDYRKFQAESQMITGEQQK